MLARNNKSSHSKPRKPSPPTTIRGDGQCCAAVATYCVLYALRRRNATPSWERANPVSGPLVQPSGGEKAC